MTFNRFFSSISVAGLAFCATTSNALAFTPSTLFEGVMSAAVSYNQNTRLFRYQYKVGNSASSQQSIQDFGVTYETKNIVNIESPSGWDPELSYSGENILLWFYVGENSTPIPPGARQTGFAFSSPCLPSIQSWLAQSSYVYEAQDLDEELDIQKKNLAHIFNNCNKGSIVGPGQMPPSSPSTMLNIVMDVLDKETRYEWITSRGLSNSLRVKLDAASNSIARGQTTPARNQVKSFINEVDAQTGKSLSPTAADLLKSNASYLLTII